ncbi:unnamed protein product [Chironomus riparius]|uniref:WD repeat-containing protein 37 n=1 Tax=Chironomus riparius TaxID=315576 RepID=A0A9N9RXE4_9DIPT|nr:unnamed protein product [Chironomus riparius]
MMDRKKNTKVTPDSEHQHRIKRLLQELEKEFDNLISENLNLQEQLNRLNTESGTNTNKENERADYNYETENKKLKSKITSSGIKIRGQASRIVSSFKTQSIVCNLVREFSGVHNDGIWETSCSQLHPIIASASADHLSCIFSIDSGKCLLKYEGHTGSVNSVKFHPSKELMLTSSGDNTAHIWQGAVNYETVSTRRCGSSEEELDDDTDDIIHHEEKERIDTLRTPLQEFSGHSSVVVSADWISQSNNESPTQIITASWDRTAILWDIETKTPIQTLTGHDNELTHCSAHSSNRLVVTSSRDSTFRLWDFRSDIPAVSVFQGHIDSVTSTIFSKEDQVLSGSDDKSVKIWELRNMRSPLFTIRTDSAVNRLAVSSNGLIAIPNDNRSIRIFELNGQRISRIQKRSHRRMVTSCCFKEGSSVCNLFSSGFDRKVYGWNISV